MNTKILLLVFIIGLFIVACNDGNLEVETISFENTDVLSCSTNDTTATFLFKYNQKQALILTLPTGVLENKEKTVTGSIPSNYKLYYRTFSEAVSTAYFCATYPPATPNVISEIQATGGTITIATRPIYDETTGALLRYDHQISISNLVLVNTEGNKVVDSNFIFGTYRTVKP
nr:hypothetical protein [uncultured Capnocytophaga sp.]